MHDDFKIENNFKSNRRIYLRNIFLNIIRRKNIKESKKLIDK